MTSKWRDTSKNAPVDDILKRVSFTQAIRTYDTLKYFIGKYM